MRSASRAALVALAALAFASAAHAAPGALRVTGDLPRIGSVSRAELEALGVRTAAWTDNDTTHAVTGVPLDQVLRHFGWTPGPMTRRMAPAEKRPGYKQVVIARAPDGFVAVFSCAELDSVMTGASRVLVVWEMDGAPLPAEQGAMRLVSLGDREGSRSIYQLESLEVVDLRKRAPRP